MNGFCGKIFSKNWIFDKFLEHMSNSKYLEYEVSPTVDCDMENEFNNFVYIWDNS